MPPSQPQTTPSASTVVTTSSRTPLLSDEELDALIQAFNRRESVSLRWSPWRMVWGFLILSVIAMGWWWW